LSRVWQVRLMPWPGTGCLFCEPDMAGGRDWYP